MTKQFDAGWISVASRNPKQYHDVLILVRMQGEIVRRVGRLNHANCWELASYQSCKNQYMASGVIAWFDEQLITKFSRVAELCVTAEKNRADRDGPLMIVDLREAAEIASAIIEKATSEE